MKKVCEGIAQDIYEYQSDKIWVYKDGSQGRKPYMTSILNDDGEFDTEFFPTMAAAQAHIDKVGLDARRQRQN